MWNDKYANLIAFWFSNSAIRCHPVCSSRATLCIYTVGKMRIEHVRFSSVVHPHKEFKTRLCHLFKAGNDASRFFLYGETSHMHCSGGILAHSSLENGLQILLEKCSRNLFCIIWSLVLSLDFPFGFRSGGWLFILLLWRDFWLCALGHCSVHSGVIFSFLLDGNGFLSRTTVGVSFLLSTWCVL